MDLDKSVIGLTGPVFTVEVEKGHIRRFAQAIDDPNPLFSDAEAAAVTAYKGIVAPPTFGIAISQAGTDQGAELPLKLDYRRMLHGEQEFIYYKPIRPGDVLSCQTKVSDLYERDGKSGRMQFLVIDTEAKDKAGEMVVISRTVVVYKPLKA